MARPAASRRTSRQSPSYDCRTARTTPADDGPVPVGSCRRAGPPPSASGTLWLRARYPASSIPATAAVCWCGAAILVSLKMPTSAPRAAKDEPHPRPHSRRLPPDPAVCKAMTRRTAEPRTETSSPAHTAPSSLTEDSLPTGRRARSPASSAHAALHSQSALGASPASASMAPGHVPSGAKMATGTELSKAREQGRRVAPRRVASACRAALRQRAMPCRAMPRHAATCHVASRLPWRSTDPWNRRSSKKGSHGCEPTTCRPCRRKHRCTGRPLKPNTR